MNKKNQQFQQDVDQSLAENKKACHSREGGNLEMTENDTDKSRDALQCVATDKKIAVKVDNVSKIFKIPHKKIDSMKSAFVNSLKKNTYEEFYALKDISVEVKKGEFLGIIGHNGAGKSTLLKILAGVYQPSSGSIKVDGMISPFLELGIGFNPELSGRDNVYLNATVLGLAKKQIDEKFDEIVKFAELNNFIDEQLKNYSSGMKARLAFSVSIHADREILIMDEVLAVGDSRFQEKCLNIFKGYKEMGKTVILVTHSMETVREYCDQALLLHKGELLGSGDVNEVCNEYLLKNEINTKEVQKELKIRKQKTVKIRNIEILDEDNNQLEKITKGDNFLVKIYVDVQKIADDLDVAIQIFDKRTNQMICDNNTVKNKFNCSWQVGKNVFEIKFKNTMFNQGQIYLKAFLYFEGERGIVEEFCSDGNYLKMLKIKRQEGHGGGIMCIEHMWSKIDEG